MTSEHPFILSLDTATRCSTVALTRGTLQSGEVLGSLSLSSNVTHSRRLLTTIDWLFKETKTDWSHIGGIAVGLGPGSFTGLRIGMATAKGLAATAQLPLIGVASLDTVAALCTTDKLICACLDARKKEVYAGFYRLDTHGIARRTGDIIAIGPEELLEKTFEPVMMVGDAVPLYGKLWQEKGGSTVELGPSLFSAPSAASLGLLAGEKLARGDLLDLASATPLYVRASDAELSLKTAKEQKMSSAK